jgi:methylenetetrahydrofolate reductase (NADPH)
MANLVDRLQRMATLEPAWISVTWGAGGSTQARSLDLAAAAQEAGLDVCLHLTCTNMERRKLDDTLSVSSVLMLANP